MLTGANHEAGKTVRSAQARSAAASSSSPDALQNLLQSIVQPGNRIDDPRGDPDETHVTRTVGCATAPTQDAQYSISTCAQQETKERIAVGKEAASAQAVKRGHMVTMIEVPDEEDDTAYQRWLTKGSPLGTLTRPVATIPMPPDSLIQIG